MSWMNEYEIDDAVRQYGDHPVLGPATRTLSSLRDATNANSDGWPYWTKPSRAASRLMELIHYDTERRPRRRSDASDDATVEQLRAALRPIKAFRTKSGIDFAIYDGGAGDVAILAQAARKESARLLVTAIAALLATSAGLSGVGDTDVADEAHTLAQGAIALREQLTGE